MIKVYLPLRIFKHHGILCIRLLRFFLDQFKNFLLSKTFRIIAAVVVILLVVLLLIRAFFRRRRKRRRKLRQNKNRRRR